MNILQIATTILGILMSLGYYPQAYKIYRSKSGENISFATYFTFGIGTLLWTIYGFSINDIIIILSFIPGVIGSWLVLFLAFHYRNNKVNL
ncbi:MAG: SemiSWEET family transporter [Candidatus Paceibacterota bacterium]|jgi:MtN3 and saliva related transmembrane protein